MPLMTTSAYPYDYWSHEYFASDNLINIFNEIYENKNYQPLENYLNNGGNPYELVNWEYAIAVDVIKTKDGALTTVIFDGQTTFTHVMAIFGGMPAVDILAAHHVDFNQNATFNGTFNDWKPIDGTPLHLMFCYNGLVWEEVSQLLDYGALPNITNSSGQTAIDIAYQMNYPELAAQVIDYMTEHDMSFDKITPEEYLALVDAQQKIDAENVQDVTLIEDHQTSPESTALIEDHQTSSASTTLIEDHQTLPASTTLIEDHQTLPTSTTLDAEAIANKSWSVGDYFQYYILDWFKPKESSIKLSEVINTDSDVLQFNALQEAFTANNTSEPTQSQIALEADAATVFIPPAASIDMALTPVIEQPLLV